MLNFVKACSTAEDLVKIAKTVPLLYLRVDNMQKAMRKINNLGEPIDMVNMQ